MKTIEALKWRYATKRFDSTKSISNESLENLKEAIQLTATSYGLQPFKVIVVQDKETKTKLRAAAYNQPQLEEADAIFVFCNQLSPGNKEIDDYIQNISDTRNFPVENLKGFEDYMKGAVNGISESDKAVWTAKQTYIALGSLLIAAGELHIDACPMEGFEPGGFNEILGLKEKGLNAAVIAAVGYRSSEDQTQFLTKVRKSKEDLFLTV